MQVRVPWSVLSLIAPLGAAGALRTSFVDNGDRKREAVVRSLAYFFPPLFSMCTLIIIILKRVFPIKFHFVKARKQQPLHPGENPLKRVVFVLG